MAIKLTKNEQKLQKDRLKQYQRYLPTLQLKKQQLQAVITKTKADLEQKEVERAQMIGDLDDWVAVFAENEIFAESKAWTLRPARYARFFQHHQSSARSHPRRRRRRRNRAAGDRA